MENIYIPPKCGDDGGDEWRKKMNFKMQNQRVDR